MLALEVGPFVLYENDNESLSDSSLVTNLTYTQALILLGIPEEEREEFIAEHDVESMTKVELQQVNDYKLKCSTELEKVILRQRELEIAGMIVENMAKRLKVWPPVIRTNLSINTTHSERS